MVVISHNGMDVDIKMASRVTGIDAILGLHPRRHASPLVVKNAKGQTLVTNAGSNSKFLGVLDFDVRGGKVQDFRYKLLPVFANLLPADGEMQAYIDKMRAPYKAKLDEKLAVSEGLLYRRGNFNGSGPAHRRCADGSEEGADMAFSPGFRWGTTILPGRAITRELMMDQVAITYPTSTLTEMTGDTIKTIMEDVCDNLFNPDPYYQQGGDMVRVGGMAYTCDPKGRSGQAHQQHDAERQTRGSQQNLQGGWLGTRGRRGQGRAHLGRDGGLFQNHKTISPRKINTPSWWAWRATQASRSDCLPADKGKAPLALFSVCAVQGGTTPNPVHCQSFAYSPVASKRNDR